jgi:hypothetical protein
MLSLRIYNSKIPREESLLSIFYILPILVIGVFPTLNYILLPLIIYFINSKISKNQNKLARISTIYFLIILALTNAVVFAGRSVFINFNDDFSNIYWNQFIELKSREFGFIFSSERDETYTSEYAYYIFVWLISHLIPSLSPSGFLLIIVFTNSILIYFSFLIFFENNLVEDKKVIFLLFISSLFISYGLMTQLVRQFFSVSFILFFLVKPKFSRILLLITAFFFHQTSILTFFVFAAIKYLNRFTLFFLGFLVLIIYYNVDFLLGILSNSSNVKLSFYTEVKFSEDAFEYNYVFLPFAFVFCLIGSWGIFKKRNIYWNKFLLTGMAVYCLTINIPLLAVRSNLIFFAVLLGFYFSINYIYRFSKNALVFIAFFLGIFLFYKNTYLVQRGEDRLWYTYSPFTKIPFSNFSFYIQ